MAILKNKDLYAPHYRIKVGNTFLPDNIMKYVISVEYEDNAEMMDMITIVLGAQTVTDRNQSYKILDSKLFNEGNLIELYFGYGVDTRAVGAAEIVRVEPNYPMSGIPTLTIIGYDITHRLAARKSITGDNYKNFKDSQIATIVGQRHKLNTFSPALDGSFNIQATEGIHERVQKIGDNDYELMRKISDFNGYDFFVRYPKMVGIKKWVLYFQKIKENVKPIYKYTYNSGDEFINSTLLEFSPDMNLKDQNIEYQILSFDKTAGTNINGLNRGSGKEFTFNKSLNNYEWAINNDRKYDGTKKLIDNKKPNMGKPGSIKFKAFGRTREIIVSKLRSEKAANTHVEAWIRKNSGNFITGTGKIIGTETLQTRQVITLAGLGETMNGDYYLSQVIHKGGGNGSTYMCDFSCRRVII